MQAMWMLDISALTEKEIDKIWELKKFVGCGLCTGYDSPVYTMTGPRFMATNDQMLVEAVLHTFKCKIIPLY